MLRPELEVPAPMGPVQSTHSSLGQSSALSAEMVSDDTFLLPRVFSLVSPNDNPSEYFTLVLNRQEISTM